MSLAWQPSPGSMEEIVSTLLTLSDPSKFAFHSHSQEVLARYTTLPEFCLYLSYLLRHSHPGIPKEIRQLSGILLAKQIPKLYIVLPSEAQSYIKDNTLNSLQDPELVVRTASGSIVGSITTTPKGGGIQGWPALIPLLKGLLETRIETKLDGALSALLYMLEDSLLAEQADRTGFSLHLSPLVLPLLSLLSISTNTRISKSILKCINAMIPLMPNGLMQALDNNLALLANLGKHEDANVRQKVLQSFTLMLYSCFEIVWNSVNGIFLFMLQALQDPSNLVVLEAAEFFIAYSDLQQGLEAMAEVLPQLIPLLLKNMAYSREEIGELMLEGSENDHIPDRPEDVAPLFRKKRGSDEDDEGQISSTGDSWTARKCCAACMDSISVTFGPDAVLPNLLPQLQDKLVSSDVWVKESAVLCLGAVCSGAGAKMEEHMSQLAPFLLAQTNDPCPQLRCMACWTLSRYVDWITNQSPPEAYFGPLVRALLDRMLDLNKKVQESACSALSALAEEAIEKLIPYLHKIIPVLLEALKKYQIRCLIVLYDTIGTLAEYIGPRDDTQEALLALVPTIMNKWQYLDTNQQQAFPLMECITCLIGALNTFFQPYALPIFKSCLELIENTIYNRAVQQANGECFDPDFGICALDLLSALAEGLGHGFDGLLGGSNLLNLLLECCKDRDAGLRQSSFALIGDLSKTTMPRLMPALPAFIPHLVAGIDAEHPQACINALWALSEISSHSQAQIEQYAVEIINKLILLGENPLIKKVTLNPMNNDLMPEDQMQLLAIMENVALLLANMGEANPSVMAPKLSQYSPLFCNSIYSVKSKSDLETVFRSFLNLIRMNPEGILISLAQFCMLVATLYRSRSDPLPQDLGQYFALIFNGYKSNLPSQWNSAISSLPSEAKDVLYSTFSLM